MSMPHGSAWRAISRAWSQASRRQEGPEMCSKISQSATRVAGAPWSSKESASQSLREAGSNTVTIAGSM